MFFYHILAVSRSLIRSRAVGDENPYHGLCSIYCRLAQRKKTCFSVVKLLILTNISY